MNLIHTLVKSLNDRTQQLEAEVAQLKAQLKVAEKIINGEWAAEPPPSYEERLAQTLISRHEIWTQTPMD